MKWIGQHIWDFVSRFRNTIILQPKDQTNTDDYAQLDVDPDGGITFATFDAAGTDANVRANIDGAFTLTTAAGSLNSTNINSEEVNIASSVSNKPLLNVTSTHTDTDKSAELKFIKDADNVADGENLGLISFYGDNDAGTPEVINYANVLAEAADMTDGQEAGKLTLNVAVYNGTSTPGIIIDGDTNVDEQVNVTIGSGEGSVTTIAGPLNIASTLVMDESGLVAVANQSSITGVGTITSGEWRGTAIASAYLDADTAHYSAQKQLTYYMFKDALDADKHYVGLQEADAESENSTNKNLPMLAPFAGKLLKVFLRATTDISTKTLTWTLETQAAGSNTGAAPSVVGTKAGAGCTNQTMTTYDFTTGVTGDNIIDAGDTIQLALESDSSIADTTYYITCLWEWNLS